MLNFTLLTSVPNHELFVAPVTDNVSVLLTRTGRKWVGHFMIRANGRVSPFHFKAGKSWEEAKSRANDAVIFFSPYLAP